MNYKINQEQLNSVINYLASKPFIEVFQLINILQTIPKIAEDSKVDTDEINKVEPISSN